MEPASTATVALTVFLGMMLLQGVATVIAYRVLGPVSELPPPADRPDL